MRLKTSFVARRNAALAAGRLKKAALSKTKVFPVLSYGSYFERPKNTATIT